MKKAKTPSKEEIYNLIQDYNTNKYRVKELALKYDISQSCINVHFKKNNVKCNLPNSKYCRKYTLNEKFFDIIDTEDKAYFLGLMYADGNVGKSLNKKTKVVSYYFGISLEAKDKLLLEKFLKALETNTPLRIIKPSLKNKSFIQTKNDQFVFKIHSSHIVHALIDKGCTINKTFTITFPENKIPKDLIRHFIRGYFDGDGTIGLENCEMYSSEFFSKQLQIYLKENLNINFQLRFRRNCWGLYTNGGLQLRKFLDFIYKDSTIYMDRKYKLYEIHKKYENYLNTTKKGSRISIKSFFSEMKSDRPIELPGNSLESFLLN